MGDGGLYDVVVNSPCGEAISRPALLTVACPPDFNGDGILDSLDALAFLNAFNDRDPRADYDRNGTINTLDFIGFLNAFNAGC